VLKLRKALYGLKQSRREWFSTLTNTLKSIGFSSLNFDPYVFYRNDLLVLIYVDDLLIIGTRADIHEFKPVITSKFKCKDIG